MEEHEKIHTTLIVGPNDSVVITVPERVRLLPEDVQRMRDVFCETTGIERDRVLIYSLPVKLTVVKPTE